jgi:hypothetical protein
MHDLLLGGAGRSWEEVEEEMQEELQEELQHVLQEEV